jgi:acyl transferase domain-containing protein/SAM-dependent methyltransferase
MWIACSPCGPGHPEVTDFLDRIASLSPKRLVLLAHELNEELGRERAKTHQPIAIVGLAFRFPGAGDDPEALWRHVAAGDDLIRPAPSDRWDLDQPLPGSATHSAAGPQPRGGYLPRVDEFDPLFFGISPREAETMDPQQRLLLEVGWEALENAAIAPAVLGGSRTGVFVGIAGSDFAQRVLDQDSERLDGYMASGASHAVAAGRLAYALDLSGPCMSIDTACSSSLVAISAACDSLRLGRSNLALAGGVSLILSPETTIILAKAGMLSPSFRCRSFDAAADGFVRGEGCGVVVLKRLTDAERDGDRIRAVIRGTAVNQDGRSSGLTAPNGPAQQSLLRDALSDADVRPGQVQYIEAHGTGTRLGDPIEAQALEAVFGPDRPREEPLWIGSIKANFGHLEAAAGLAGLIKLVLCLEHGTIPPLAGLTSPNPHVDWKNSPLALPRHPTPWPGAPSRRIGGVSSFGFSGTNAHLVVSAPPSVAPPSRPERSHHLLCLSARTRNALGALAARYVEYLDRNPETAASDLCFTANAGRNHHPERLAIVSQDIAGFRMRLAQAPVAFAAECKPDERTGPPQIAFLFTGQGSQYFGMARALYAAEPAFAATIDRCDAILGSIWDHSLTALLFSEDGDGGARLSQTGFTQPALFSVEVALADLLMSWGVRPAAVLGHSVGEYAAACIAGVFSLEDGLRLIAKRAKLMQSLPSGGGMVAVLAGEAEVARAIASFPTLSVAAFNGPSNIVVSGPLRDLDRLVHRLEASGAACQPLAVSHAFHSALLEPMLTELEREADSLSYGEPRFPVISNLTGRCARGDELRSGAYWRNHARMPVRFADGVRALRALNCTAFVEIGPAPVLSGMARRVLRDSDFLWLPTLRQGRADLDQVLDSVGQLYEAGVDLDFPAMMGDARAYRKRSLPTYPFERSRYWPTIKARAAVSCASAPKSETEPCCDWLYEPEWRPSPEYAETGQRAACIPDTGFLLAAIDKQVAALQQSRPAGANDLGYAAIDRLCRDYIREALGKLGCALSPGDAFSTAELFHRLGVAHRHKRLFARMISILAEDGIIAGDADGWRISASPEPPSSEGRLNTLAADYPEFATELAVLAPCGASLAEVLQGRRDPLELLFPGGSLDVTTRLYSDPAPVRTFNGLIASCVEAIVERLPADRRLSILEVGAGTGGTTARVLPHLPPDRTRYLFTDISREFLDRASTRFRDYEFVDYDIFNLDDPPSDRPELQGAFDVVIVANAVHATIDLRRSLDALHRLLRPDGLLILLEVVRPQRMADLTVGLTDGWWAFKDSDVRPDYPLVSAERWARFLDETGFTGAVAVPTLGQGTDRLLSNQSILLARRAAEAVSPGLAAGSAARGRWLVFADQAGIGDKLAADLEIRGGECLMARRGSDFRETRGDFRIRPMEAADHAHVLRTFAGANPDACRGVVYLWGLDADFHEGDEAGAVLGCVEAACRPALLAIQAMAGAAWRGGRITIVTRGARPTQLEPSPIYPAQAALWGMAGVLALEHPELRCRRVDLVDAAASGKLADELLRADAVEPNGRRVLRLARSRAGQGSVPSLRFRGDAAYLVTGGFTGIGLETARWLAARGAGHLVLVGRNPPDAKARAVAEEIGRGGNAPICLTADIGDPRAAAGVFARLDDEGLDLAGVVHSAGTLSDASVLRQDWARFATVMRAKVEGAWNLHRLTQSRRLDFFVLYSSGASLLGSVGQANHAAANAFMDSLAFLRRAAGLPALSINWGAWRDVGAAADHGVLRKAEAEGVSPIDVEGGLRALERAMIAGSFQVAVLPIDWTRLDTRQIPILRDVDARPTAGRPAPDTEEEDEKGRWRVILETAAPALRRSWLRELLEHAAAKTLGLKPFQTIDPQQPLQETGLDSLLSLQLRNRIASGLTIELPPTLHYNYPTINLLADYLLGQLFVGLAPAAAPRQDIMEPDDLTEEELALLLEDQINLD